MNKEEIIMSVVTVLILLVGIVGILLYAGRKDENRIIVTSSSSSSSDSSSTIATDNAPPEGELKIVDNVVGTGVEAKDGDTLVVNYTGKLEDGTVFDTNTDFKFTLGQDALIQGWVDGMKGMKVGGQRTLNIPWNLGYGAQGSGTTIPPYSNLIFDIELTAINPEG